jgi:hypothetical protein
MKSQWIVGSNLLLVFIACSGQSPERPVVNGKASTQSGDAAASSHAGNSDAASAGQGQRGSSDLETDAAGPIVHAVAPDTEGPDKPSEPNGPTHERHDANPNSDTQAQASGQNPDVLPELPKDIADQIPPEAVKAHIAQGLDDFVCAKKSSAQVACQAVDSSGKPVILPSDVKVEWFSSEGSEDSLKPIMANVAAPNGTNLTGSSPSPTWVLNFNDFSDKPVLARITRGSLQADIYVVPD